jgi:hypothetical protein
MSVARLKWFLVFSFPICLVACSNSSVGQPPGNTRVQFGQGSPAAFAPLLDRVWRRSDSAYGPAAGSIYIFLQNGTLLETSCVETYRIARWSADPANPGTLRVMEDQQQVFTAILGEASGSMLHLRQKLLRESEPREITLTAIDGEFVCPDLPK